MLIHDIIISSFTFCRTMSENPTLSEPVVESSRAYFSVNFACQKCGNPLNLDDSFYDYKAMEDLQTSTCGELHSEPCSH